MPASSTPVGPSPNDGKGQVGVAFGWIAAQFGPLESQKQTAADRVCILQRFQTWGICLPFIMAEVGVARASCQYQRIKGHAVAIL